MTARTRSRAVDILTGTDQSTLTRVRRHQAARVRPDRDEHAAQTRRSCLPWENVCQKLGT
jgi:hypothetical protein